MNISLRAAWLKYVVLVDEVMVGVLFTDTGAWSPCPLFEALTTDEQDRVLFELRREGLLNGPSQPP